MLVRIFFAICSVHLTSAQQVTSFPTPKVQTGFSPVWNDNTQSLYWINWGNIGDGAAIFRFSYEDQTVYEAKIEGTMNIGFIALVDGSTDRFVVGLDHDISIIEWDGTSSTPQVLETIFSLEKDDPTSRIVQAQPDRAGRLYVGTISDSYCAGTVGNRTLYRYTPEEGVVIMFDGVWTTAGIAFDYDINKFYHLDTCALVVTQFDYDPTTGALSNREIAFDFHSIGEVAGSFVPDGMEIDTTGNLYIPDYQSTSLYKIDPKSNSVLDIYQTGQPGINGAEFGGPNRDILYLTDSSLIVDVLTPTSEDTPDKGSYLYAMYGLGATGGAPTYFRES